MTAKGEEWRTRMHRAAVALEKCGERSQARTIYVKIIKDALLEAERTNQPEEK